LNSVYLSIKSTYQLDTKLRLELILSGQALTNKVTELNFSIFISTMVGVSGYKCPQNPQEAEQGTGPRVTPSLHGQ
jgi:hypothetical protein